MNDMTAVIVPKSDQINADDLIAGPRTIRITDVTIRPGTEQPVSIHFEGDNGKPWKTCKSMNRVLVNAWGPDAKAYIGRSVTIYRDPNVKWGGMAVGGVRISHLSHIERDLMMALTETKGKRAPFVVKPLVDAPKPADADQTDVAAKWTSGLVAKIKACADTAALDALEAERGVKLNELREKRPELYSEAIAAIQAKSADLAWQSGPADSQRGDAFDGSERITDTVIAGHAA